MEWNSLFLCYRSSHSVFKSSLRRASRDTNLCTLISLDATEKLWSGTACFFVTAPVTQFSKAVSEGQPVHQSLYSHLSRHDREPWSGTTCDCVTAPVTQFSKAVSEGQPGHQSLYSHLSLDVTEKPWSVTNSLLVFYCSIHSVLKSQSQKSQPVHQSLYSLLSSCDREAVEWNSL